MLLGFVDIRCLDISAFLPSSLKVLHILLNKCSCTVCFSSHMPSHSLCDTYVQEHTSVVLNALFAFISDERLTPSPGWFSSTSALPRKIQTQLKSSLSRVRQFPVGRWFFCFWISKYLLSNRHGFCYFLMCVNLYSLAVFYIILYFWYYLSQA